MVSESLFQRPKSFDFFEAVQILSKLHPSRAEPGRGTNYSAEVVHFSCWASMLRSPTDIRSLKQVDSERYLMEVAFMGLYGPSSPTPAYFWEYVCRHPDSALRSLLDLFGTRAVGLFYQAWKRYRWHLNFRGGVKDAMTRRCFCLVGLGTESQPTGPELADDSLESESRSLVEHPRLDVLNNRMRLLAYAGLLSQYTRPPSNLRALLLDFYRARNLSAPFEIEENVLKWIPFEPQDQCRLGNANSRLANNLLVGRRVRDRMACFRIHAGPMSAAGFERFLPTGSEFRSLTELARLASPFGTVFDVSLSLKADEIPKWSLGQKTNGRLGWTSWCGKRSPQQAGVVLLKPARFQSAGSPDQAGQDAPTL